MTISEPRVHPLIKKSSALLDRVLESPEWDRLIDIEKFDIFAMHLCVLGQTGYRQDHHGNIPDDGKVPWDGFTNGSYYLDTFAKNHPEVIEQIGLNAETVTSAFHCGVPRYFGRSQNEQWKLYLQWRRDSRDQQAGGVHP